MLPSFILLAINAGLLLSYAQNLSHLRNWRQYTHPSFNSAEEPSESFLNYRQARKFVSNCFHYDPNHFQTSHLSTQILRSCELDAQSVNLQVFRSMKHLSKYWNLHSVLYPLCLRFGDYSLLCVLLTLTTCVCQNVTTNLISHDFIPDHRREASAVYYHRSTATSPAIKSTRSLGPTNQANFEQSCTRF